MVFFESVGLPSNIFHRHEKYVGGQYLVNTINQGDSPFVNEF